MEEDSRFEDIPLEPTNDPPMYRGIVTVEVRRAVLLTIGIDVIVPFTGLCT